mmetsp:Transcript_18445/g.58878  ORF Transcript_18445/g.58878 Transcript_18445/m.58878 type:complete len:208 (-) Transcript_18445:208-831(-)
MDGGGCVGLDDGCGGHDEYPSELLEGMALVVQCLALFGLAPLALVYVRRNVDRSLPRELRVVTAFTVAIVMGLTLFLSLFGLAIALLYVHLRVNRAHELFLSLRQGQGDSSLPAFAKKELPHQLSSLSRLGGSSGVIGMPQQDHAVREEGKHSSRLLVPQVSSRLQVSSHDPNAGSNRNIRSGRSGQPGDSVASTETASSVSMIAIL